MQHQNEQEMQQAIEQPAHASDSNFKPDIVGGQNLTSCRAYFDQDDTNIIVTGDRKLLYYSVHSHELIGQANLLEEKLEVDESIVSSDKFENSMYLFTNHGQIFIWDLETRDWSNQLSLPLNENETLVSCKMLSRRQYIYSIRNPETKKVDLWYSMSRSERERPKQRELIYTHIHPGTNAFDIGCLISQLGSPVKSSPQKEKQQAKQRCLTFIKGSYVYFQKMGIGEKYVQAYTRQRIQEQKFTCVRAYAQSPMVAAGDSLGRIYLYTGDFVTAEFNRAKLHWHSLPVNDLCFSITGNTLFSVGGESGCLVAWDLSKDNIGQKHVTPRLGMPIRYVNCSNRINKLILSFEDNELQTMDTDGKTRDFRTLTRRTIDMYLENDPTSLRKRETSDQIKSIGLIWHSKSDTVVTNSRTGSVQFYSPKRQSRERVINLLETNVLTLDKDIRVVPSDITRAAITLDGDWIAFYETRECPHSSFPEVKLHIWQRSNTIDRWNWVQTADRIHHTTTIRDLKFSPDGQYLVSVGDDGSFHLLHRVCLDANTNSASASSKQMYAMGFIGNIPKGLASLAAFSQDSSVVAISLTNESTLIWSIMDPFKLVFECQLSQKDVDEEEPTGSEELSTHLVIGLHFGHNRPGNAPLCEVRTKCIRIWNILVTDATPLEYRINDKDDEFTATAFDHGSQEKDHFAVCTKKSSIMIFRLQIDQETTELKPMINFDATAPFISPGSQHYYTHMCFMANPILEIDEQSYNNADLLQLINRLCLMNNFQELVAITDKLTLERRSAYNNCNAIKTFDMSELQSYFVKNVSQYNEETRNLIEFNQIDKQTITEKQRRIRNRLEVQKMLKDLLIRVPSQNLPKMEILGPMILDKLIQ